jgi:parvulin-like peptidyl-prolyl isomerase
MARDPRKRIVTKKYLAKVERERRYRMAIMSGALVVIGLVVVLVIYGLVDMFLIRPNQPVARVENETITTRDFQARTRYARLGIIQQYNETAQLAAMFGEEPGMQDYIQTTLNQIAMQAEPISLGQNVLDVMIEEILIKQEAQRRGITVTSEEVDRALQEAFGYFAAGTPTPLPVEPTQPPPTLSPTQEALISPTQQPTPTDPEEAGESEEGIEDPGEIEAEEGQSEETGEQEDPDVEDQDSIEEPDIDTGPTPTPVPLPTPTPYTFEAFQRNYQETIQSFSRNINFSEADLRRMIEINLYRTKLMEIIVEDLPREKEHIWIRQIVVPEEETAIEAISRLEDGEDFMHLAFEYIERTGVNYSGNMDWLTEDDVWPEVWEEAQRLDIGQFSEPLSMLDGYYIIQVLGKDTRSLDNYQYEMLRQNFFQEWLDELRQSVEIEIYDIWIERVPTDPRLGINSF